MTGAALALALVAAVMHATWNLFLKDSEDRISTVALMGVVGSLLYLPWVYAVDGLPNGVWDHVVFSAVVHAAYFLALVTAYRRVDFSVAYPVARGAAPALVAFGGWVLLGDSIAAAEVVVIALIVAALIALAWSPGVLQGLQWALLTGLLISVYTLTDAAAVRESGKALSYTVTVTSVSIGLLLPFAIWQRGAAALVATARARPWQLIAASALNIGAYALVLVAATQAPVGLVSAVRESSVIIGALAGVVIYSEPFGRRRVVSAAFVAAGVVALGLM